MLRVEDLTAGYGLMQALRGVSLEIAEGELVALIGSNGSGKTTLINCISGLVPAAAGAISWQGKPLKGIPADVVCRLGIIQVPEGRKLFPQMTVEENLLMGAYLPPLRKHARVNMEKALSFFPRLAERKRQSAGSLSGGEQQFLALARALMAEPKLLMLDEPSLGLAPKAAAEIFSIVRRLNEEGLTVLLVSQEVLETLTIAKRGYVLENGTLTLAGPAEQLLSDPRVKASYLGL